jgi:hypothetical protein
MACREAYRGFASNCPLPNQWKEDLTDLLTHAESFNNVVATSLDDLFDSVERSALPGIILGCTERVPKNWALV